MIEMMTFLKYERVQWLEIMTVLVTFQLLGRDTMTKANYRGKTLLGLTVSENESFMAGNMGADRQESH